MKSKHAQTSVADPWHFGVDPYPGIHASDSDSSFVWFSTLVFTFYKMLSTKRLEFSCFADFFAGFLKLEQRLVFFENPPVERQCGAKVSSLLWNWCPRIPSRNHLKKLKPFLASEGRQPLLHLRLSPPLINPSEQQIFLWAFIRIILFHTGNQCSGSVTIRFVSGSCYCSFRQWPSRP